MCDIIAEIRGLSQKHNEINKVVLFGSRARGDNRPRSDIDLAVYADGDIHDFIMNIEENVPTLLKFDITDMNRELEADFVNQINNEGIVIYEKS